MWAVGSSRMLLSASIKKDFDCFEKGFSKVKKIEFRMNFIKFRKNDNLTLGEERSLG